jgi:hypothetical protein
MLRPQALTPEDGRAGSLNIGIYQTTRRHISAGHNLNKYILVAGLGK